MNIEQVKTALHSLSSIIKDKRSLNVGIAYTETFIPSSVYVIEPLRAICSASDEIRFEHMLKGLGSDPLDVERKMNELYNFVTDEDRAFFVSDCFRKTLLSQTPIVCCIMGLILADINSKTISINQHDAIIMNAITNFTDNDIRNFYDITSGQYTVNASDNKYIEEQLFPSQVRTDYNLTVDLCCQNRIFSKTFWVDDNGSGHLNAVTYGEVAVTFRNYITRARRQLQYGK